MSAYHVMLVHFPIALWTTAFLIVLARALSEAPAVRAAEGALTPLLALGALSGAAAFVVEGMEVGEGVADVDADDPGHAVASSSTKSAVTKNPGT